MPKCNYDDPLDVLTNGIEQGFMQRGGWKNCRYLLGKLVAERDDPIEKIRAQWDSAVKAIKEFGKALEKLREKRT